MSNPTKGSPSESRSTRQKTLRRTRRHSRQLHISFEPDSPSGTSRLDEAVMHCSCPGAALLSGRVVAGKACEGDMPWVCLRSVPPACNTGVLTAAPETPSRQLTSSEQSTEACR